MSLRLLTRASSGRHCVIGTGSSGASTGSASTGSTRASARSKTDHFKGPACIESSFLDFGTGPGSGGSKRLIFLRPGLYRMIIFGFWHASGLWGGRRVASPCHWDC